MKYSISAAIIMACAITPAFANQSCLSVGLCLDAPLMNKLLDNGTAFDNELDILKAKPTLQPSTLYVGGYAQAGLNYYQADQPTYFYSINRTYQSHFTPSIDRAAIALIANINEWMSMYGEFGVTDVGQNYVSQIGVNQLYLLLGGEQTFLYGYAGYKNIDFGNFSSVTLFAQPITRWDYAGTAMTVGIGFLHSGFNFTGSVLRRGTQGLEDYYGAGLWRVHVYPQYYTDQANNFALNTSYQFTMHGIDMTVGGGYIRGLWLGAPKNFFNNRTIGAWDINSQLRYKHFTLLVEYVQSTPATSSFGPFITANPHGVYLKTWDIGVSYQFNTQMLPNTTTVSADMSGVIGNSSFANVTQSVLGIRYELNKYFKTGFEYVLEVQSSDEAANRSGLFYRQHDKVQVTRLDLTASF